MGRELGSLGSVAGAKQLARCSRTRAMERGWVPAGCVQDPLCMFGSMESYNLQHFGKKVLFLPQKHKTGIPFAAICCRV